MANHTIDKVEIAVEASAKSVNDVFDSLTNNLKTLKASLTGFNTNGLTKLSNQLTAVSNKIDAVTSKISTSGSNANFKPTADSSNIDKTTSKIEKDIERVKNRLISVQPLLNAALSGDKSSATSFQRTALSIEGDIEVIKNKLESIRNVKVYTPDFITLQNQIETTRANLETLIAKEQEMKNNGLASSQNQDWVDLQTAIGNVNAELSTYEAKENAAKQSGDAWYKPYDKLKSDLQAVSGELDTANSKAKNFKTTVSLSTVKSVFSEFKSELQGVISKITQATTKLLTMTGSAVKNGFTSLGSSLGKIKNTLTGIGSSATSGVIPAFKTILKYVFGIRSLYVLFRRLRTAIKDSFTQLQKSGAYYETTKENVESLKTALLTLKYQFGAAFEPIFNTVAPALITFINYIIDAMNTLSAFFAKLTGKNTYSKVASVTAAANDAADATKKLNKQLQKFDELNNLTSSNSTSTKTEESAVYEEATVESALGDFGSKLAEYIKSGNWGAVGSAISEKLEGQLSSLNSKWSTIFEKAGNFGTELAKFFKGLITPTLFAEVGTALGNALKTVLTTTKAFAEEMNKAGDDGKTGWQKLGESISSGINAFVKTNPLSLLVENFNLWANGILDALIEAVKGIEWDDIAQQVADAISEVDASGIGWKLGKLANSLASALYTLVSKKETWTNIGQKIADGINNFVAGMSEKDAETGLTGFQSLAKSIVNIFTGVADAISTALENIEWEDVGQGINQMFSSIEWDKIKASLTRLKDAFKEAIKGLLTGMDIDAKDIVIGLVGVSLVVQTILGVTLASAITKIALTKLIETAVVKLLTGSGAAAATTGAAASSGTAVSVFSSAAPLLLNIAAVTLGIAAAATIGWQFGKTFGEFLATWLSNKGLISKESADEYSAIMDQPISAKFKDIKLSIQEGTFADAWTNMWGDWFDPVFAEVENLPITVLNWSIAVNDKVVGFGKAWTDFWADWFEPAFAEVENFAISIKGWAISVANGAKSFATAWTEFWGGLGEKAYETVNVSVSLIKSGWTTVSGWVNNAAQKGSELVTKGIDLIKNGWTSVTGWLNSAAQKGSDVVSGAVGLVKSGWESISKWVDTNAVAKKASALVELAKSGWEKLNDWVSNNAVAKKTSALIELTKSGWTQLSDWVSNNAVSKKVSALIDLTKSGWTQLATWVSSNAITKKTSALIELAKSGWSKLGDWVSNNAVSKKTSAFVELAKKGWKSLKGFIFDLPNKLASYSFKPIEIGIKLIKSGWSSIKKFFGLGSGGILGANGGVRIFADGGFISRNATKTWKGIPAYGSGTNGAHGTMFLAGEAGPEIVGHIGGRTEVLNKSQLASTMKFAVESGMFAAMSGMQFNFVAAPSQLGYSTEIGSSTAMSASNELMSEQNRLLQEQNRLLERIANKKFSVSSREIFDAALSESNRYYDKTGTSPFLF